MHFNGENISEHSNIWSPDLLVRWYEEQKELLELREVDMNIIACNDQYAFN